MTTFTEIPKQVEEDAGKVDVTPRAGTSSRAQACWS